MSPPTKRLKPSTTDWFLFPWPIRQAEQVLLKSKSANETRRFGKVSALLENRALVRFDDEQEKSVAMKRLIPILSPTKDTTKIIITAETNHYRNLAASHVASDDRVLEIGCSTGQASLIITKIASEWVGLDISETMIDRCRAQKSLKKAFCVDAIKDTEKTLEIVQNNLTSTPTVVFVDIGGNRELEGVLQILSWVLSTFVCTKLVIVKSRALVSKLDSECPGSSNTGEILGATKWFQSEFQILDTKLPSHPLQASLKYSPLAPEKPICRYHNYHPDGCKRFKDNQQCELDHEHCHHCREKGHTALLCPHVNS
jgi:SAM-dependent methyltransferase